MSRAKMLRAHGNSRARVLYQGTDYIFFINSILVVALRTTNFCYVFLLNFHYKIDKGDLMYRVVELQKRDVLEKYVMSGATTKIE